jgi:hypothetical protein
MKSEKQDPDPHQSDKVEALEGVSGRYRIRFRIILKGRIRIIMKGSIRIRFRIKVKSRIRIRITVMGIGNTASKLQRASSSRKTILLFLDQEHWYKDFKMFYLLYLVHAYPTYTRSEQDFCSISNFLARPFH